MPAGSSERTCQSFYIIISRVHNAHTNTLGELGIRKEMHTKEEQLQEKANEEQKHLRNKYVNARAAYSKVARLRNKVYQRNRSEQLERDLESPNRLWRFEKMNMRKAKKQGGDLWM